MPGSSVVVHAFAKVNFGLRVLYRRPDKFHELRTVFQTVSLADRIEIEYGRGGRSEVELTCNRPELAGPENLAARAARVLLDTAGRRARVRIRLEKRIPAGAGLGGGSSDAAAVLMALAGLLPKPPAWEVLLRLAAELGSDVPFFLLGGRALGVGRGAEIYPLPDLPAQWLLIAAPGLHVSTAEAYRRLSRRLTKTRWEDKIDRFCSTICMAGQGPENDFESVVFRMHPELERLKARLVDLGACPALLCGSGSALFGGFTDRRQALRARESLALEGGECFVVRTVGRAGYRAFWRKWMSRTRRSN
jgi:4-diphosphocytidyl-2-C-methyl-D-erythritol kinase